MHRKEKDSWNLCLFCQNGKIELAKLWKKNKKSFSKIKKAYARNRSGSCVEDEKDKEQGQENEIVPEAGILMVV